ncbi:MAG: hypothetical protein PVG83_09550 [Acidimicrobiia bacterium]
MSIRRFLRELFRPSPSDSGPARHGGHELSDHVREVLGPQAGGGEGRLTGHSVYNLLEDEVASTRLGQRGTPS